MSLDYETLVLLRQSDPAWRLLKSDHAPFLAAFLQRAFLVPNRRVMPLADLGTGYGVELLRHANWLSNQCIHYWGDIDTHGFAILDQLRRRFDHVVSFLMDHETFMTFRHLAAVEAVQSNRDLTTLTDSEQALCNDLRDHKFGINLRLEQEKIGFSWVQSAVARIINDTGHCDNSVEYAVPAGLID